MFLETPCLCTKQTSLEGIKCIQFFIMVCSWFVIFIYFCGVIFYSVPFLSVFFMSNSIAFFMTDFNVCNVYPCIPNGGNLYLPSEKVIPQGSRIVINTQITTNKVMFDFVSTFSMNNCGYV